MVRGQGSDTTQPSYLLSSRGFPHNAEPHSSPLVSHLSGHQNSLGPGCDNIDQEHTLRVSCVLGVTPGTIPGVSDWILIWILSGKNNATPISDARLKHREVE